MTNFRPKLDQDATFVPTFCPNFLSQLFVPTFIIIYINDIFSSSKDCKFILFADDTNIFIAGETERDAYDRANEVLSKVYFYI